MIDLHHHLIYGMDDGAQNLEQTKQMIGKAAENGVKAIVTTPHAVPGQIFFDMPLYLDHLQMMQNWCRETGVEMKLYPGAEIFYTSNTLRMLDERRIPTLNHSRYVLLEFAGNATFDDLLKAARQMVEAEYCPVYAHVERYGCLRSMGHLRRLREKYGVLMQMNADTLLHQNDFWKRLWCRRVLEAGMIDVVASDAHNMHSRKCRMGAAYETLAALGGQELAQELCEWNPLRVICRE